MFKILSKQERELLLEEALTGVKRQALKNYASVDSLPRKINRALNFLKTSREPVFRYKLRMALKAFQTIPVPKHSNYLHSFEDRIQMLYAVLPEVKRLNSTQRIQLIELIKENPKIFFTKVSEENMEKISKLLGKDLELFARKVCMYDFGRYAKEKLFNFAQGARENLKYFAKGLLSSRKEFCLPKT